MTRPGDRTASQDAHSIGTMPLISIVMPVFNEASHIDRAFDAIDRQTYPADLIEIIVVDGGSGDGTVESIDRRKTVDPRIRRLGGPRVNTPLAMNLGIEAAHGALIAKIDGHGSMNPEFLATAQASLEADASAGCVGGIVEPLAVGPTERAISIARFSRFGVGGGVYTVTRRLRYVDTVQCGVYRRTALDEAGSFDADLPYGEDEELNFRIRRAGWRILSHPGMTFRYRVRPTVRSLFRQYYNYGRARVAVVRKHPSFLRAKHVVPAAVVVTLIVATIGITWAETRALALTLWIAYAGSVAIAATSLAASHRFGRPDLVFASLVALHLGYGAGSIKGLIDLLRSSARRRHVTDELVVG